MLRAIPRNASFFQATIIFCFLMLISSLAYVDERHDLRDPTKYSFNVKNFLVTLGVCVSISGALFIYFKAATKVFAIYDNRVEFKFYLKAKQQFLLQDIKEISWSSRKQIVGTRVSGRRETARGDSLSIILMNGDVFYFDVTEYKNFDELRAWFLTYGRNVGIIKIEPINYRGRG